MKKRQKRKILRRRVKAKNCPFCKNKTEPDYKDIPGIQKYITERGRIITRLVSGICQKHQRRLTVAIKRARFLATLPFIVRPS